MKKNSKAIFSFSASLVINVLIWSCFSLFFTFGEIPEAKEKTIKIKFVRHNASNSVLETENSPAKIQKRKPLKSSRSKTTLPKRNFTAHNANSQSEKLTSQPAWGGNYGEGNFSRINSNALITENTENTSQNITSLKRFDSTVSHPISNTNQEAELKKEKKTEMPEKSTYSDPRVQKIVPVQTPGDSGKSVSSPVITPSKEYLPVPKSESVNDIGNRGVKPVEPVKSIGVEKTAGSVKNIGAPTNKTLDIPEKVKVKPVPVQKKRQISVAEFRNKLLENIGRVKSYPTQARREGIEGSATVSFDVSSLGNVSDLDIEESSGNALLDQAAIEAVQNGAPYLPLPSDKPDGLRVRVKINFALRK
jgi:TonB family protein